MTTSTDGCRITANDFSFLNLTHLRLAHVQFPSTPAYGELTFLRSLELEDVKFGQSVFNCPVLEKLMLIGCRDLSPTNFKAPNLKCILTEYSFSLIRYSKSMRKTSNPIKILGSLHKTEKFSVGLSFIKVIFIFTFILSMVTLNYSITSNCMCSFSATCFEVFG